MGKNGLGTIEKTWDIGRRIRQMESMIRSDGIAAVRAQSAQACHDAGRASRARRASPSQGTPSRAELVIRVERFWRW